MYKATFCLSADADLARVDFSSFSDQTLMETLIAGFFSMEKQKCQDSDGLFLDACEWSFVTCDADESVIAVKKSGGMGGSASLSHMPAKVGLFQMKEGSHAGTLETSFLPRCLKHFDIQMNNFRGSVEFTALPAELVDFNIYDNTFSGSADLKKLPASLKNLILGSNSFSGTLYLTNLPPKLHWMNLASNMFSGEFRVENAPESILKFCARGNSFDEVAVVPKGTMVTLENSGVTSIVDTEGNRHPWEKRMLNLVRAKLF